MAAASSSSSSTFSAADKNHSSAAMASRSAEDPASGSGSGGSRPHVMANTNSRSVSTVSVSSEGSNGSHAVERLEMQALTADVRQFKEALSRLRKVFMVADQEPNESLGVACSERLSDVLTILKRMLDKYQVLQAEDIVQSAYTLIQQVKDKNDQDEDVNKQEFLEALDDLALAFSNRVSEYITGDMDSMSSTSSKDKDGVGGRGVGGGAVAAGGGVTPLMLHSELESLESKEDMLTPDQIDHLLMRHDQGVDHALKYAKMWCKYAKDIMTYVEKRTNLQLEWARGLTKLAQATRPILKEESYLPYQSVYCTALDQDLEVCAWTQSTCSVLQGNQFMGPLYKRRVEHKQTRKSLEERWNKERKQMQESAANLHEAEIAYKKKTKEFDRCREAVRIAEQGAEIGATGDNKLDKRKRYEEEASLKTLESENVYRTCVAEANERHRQLLSVKADILQQIRELILQCDSTVKAVTVSYFQLQHKLTAPVPIQFQTLCEKSRMYEPGSQFMEFVRCGIGDHPPSNSSLPNEPFNFNMYSDDHDKRRSVDHSDDLTSAAAAGTYRFRGDKTSTTSMGSTASGAGGGSGGPMIAWTPSMGPIDPSDTDSESQNSGKSRDTSPSASPVIHSRHGVPSSEDLDNEPDGVVSSSNTDVSSSKTAGVGSGGGSGAGSGSGGGSSGATGAGSNSSSSSSAPRRATWSVAAKSHKFRKLKTPSRCRECESIIYLQGVDCQDCGLSAHKKCLELLALQCGHKRLPRKTTTFGVDLGQHLLDCGSYIPPLVCKCVHEIDKRGLKVKGIYRVPGVKPKIAKICQAFENAPELVELSDVQPHVITNVLKHYLIELPEPLLTVSLCPEFIRVAKSANPSGDEPMENEKQIVQELTDLCRKLPQHHLRTLGFLIHHLNRVAEESELNNMPASNLARMFGPTLMRTSDDSANLSSMLQDQNRTIELLNRTVELLINHSVAIFGPPESVLPKDYARFTSPSYLRPHPEGNDSKSSRGKRKEGGTYTYLGDVISSQTERRDVEVPDDFQTLPGHVSERESNEDYLTDDGDDVEAIPSCWLPDDSSKTKKSPLLNRGSADVHIIKQSLRSFSGLEGVTPQSLSTQDSLEAAQKLSKQTSAEILGSSGASSSSRRSIPQDASGTGHPRHSRPSDNLFSKVGKAAKKHSLDEEYLSPPPSAHPPLSERLSGGGSGDSQASKPTLLQAPPGASQQESSVGRSSPSEDAVDGGGGVDVMRSSTSPSSGRTSLTIGIGQGRSSSLSDDHGGAGGSGCRDGAPSGATMSVAEQRRKFLASTSTDGGHYAHHGHHLGMTHSKSSTQPPPALQPQGTKSLSSSLPTTIPNLEENKVKIQVPGGGVHHSAVNAAAIVVKQSSIDKEDI